MKIYIQCLLVLLFVWSAESAADFKVTCTIDRSKDTIQLPFRDLTLRLPIGGATSAEVLVDGKAVLSRIDTVAKRLIFTTTGTSVEVHVFGVSAQAQIGTFSTAVLRDDKKWAWSHGFDDNVSFQQYGMETFKEYGWAGTTFLIGSVIGTDSIDWTGNVVWNQMNDWNIRYWHSLGWAIGNHTWDHTCAPTILGIDTQLVKVQTIIEQALATTDPTYKPPSLAGPELCHTYDSMVAATRTDPNGPGVMFTEAQGNESGNMRIDVNGPAESQVWAGENCVTTFDTSELWIPRFGKTYCFFDASYANSIWDTDHPLEYIIDSIVKYSNSDDQHHYWFNTLEHGVDMDKTDSSTTDDSASVIGLVPYLYYHYGPGGDNTIWVAPSINIFSYVLTQRHSKLSAATIVPYTGTSLRYAVVNSKKLAGSSIDKSILTRKMALSGITIYGLRGQTLRFGIQPAAGVVIVKR